MNGIKKILRIAVFLAVVYFVWLWRGSADLVALDSYLAKTATVVSGIILGAAGGFLIGDNVKFHVESGMNTFMFILFIILAFINIWYFVTPINTVITKVPVIENCVEVLLKGAFCYQFILGIWLEFNIGSKIKKS